jgi:nitric oxide reductase large subunit
METTLTPYTILRGLRLASMRIPFAALYGIHIGTTWFPYIIARGLHVEAMWTLSVHYYGISLARGVPITQAIKSKPFIVDDNETAT